MPRAPHSPHRNALRRYQMRTHTLSPEAIAKLDALSEAGHVGGRSGAVDAAILAYEWDGTTADELGRHRRG